MAQSLKGQEVNFLSPAALVRVALYLGYREWSLSSMVPVEVLDKIDAAEKAEGLGFGRYSYTSRSGSKILATVTGGKDVLG